jgi:hypothetical protein
MYKIITLPALIHGYETYMSEKRFLRRVFRGKKIYNRKMEELT